MTEVESSMNFFDHIKELRQKLIYVIIFFIIAFIVSFYFSQSIFEFLAKPLTSILGDGNGLIYTALQEALTQRSAAYLEYDYAQYFQEKPVGNSSKQSVYQKMFPVL